MGLINLERRKYREAINNFKVIMNRYPRFHMAYYATAEAYRLMGDMRNALMTMKQADDLVRAYVHNPKGNPLDRPTIQAGTANNGKRMTTRPKPKRKSWTASTSSSPSAAHPTHS